MSDYYLIIQGKDIGPYTLDELKKLVRGGEVAGNMLVRCGQDIRPARKIVRWSWTRATVICAYAAVIFILIRVVGDRAPSLYRDWFGTYMPDKLYAVFSICGQLALGYTLSMLTGILAIITWLRGRSLIH